MKREQRMVLIGLVMALVVLGGMAAAGGSGSWRSESVYAYQVPPTAPPTTAPPTTAPPTTEPPTTEPPTTEPPTTEPPTTEPPTTEPPTTEPSTTEPPTTVPPTDQPPPPDDDDDDEPPPVIVTPYNATVGGYVQVVGANGVNLNTEPGFEAGHVQIVGRGSRLCVIAGPARADSLWWWKFRTEEGVEGWGVSDYVERQSDELCLSTPTPTSSPTRRPPTRQPASARSVPVATPTATSVVLAQANPTPTPSPVHTPLPTPRDLGVHIVHQGETLFCVGRAYGVSPWAIARRNGMYAPNSLNQGQVLNIPDERWFDMPAGPTCPRQFELPGALGLPGATPTLAGVATQPSPQLISPSAAVSPACRAVHTVVYGETLWSLARRYGGSPWVIALANHLPNPDMLFVGSQLCIP